MASDFGALTMPGGTTMEVELPADSEYGEGHVAADPITSVRFDQSFELVANASQGAPSGHSYSDGPRGRVYVDAVASGGAYEVPARSRVRIDGGEWMEVVRCAAFRDFAGRIHHWELEVR